MIYTLDNILEQSKIDNPVKYVRIIGADNKWKTHRMLQANTFELSKHDPNSTAIQIHIPEGFVWDRSSVPRPFWSLLPPDGDFVVGALIHDWLYVHSDMIADVYFNGDQDAARKFADEEMLKWSKVMYGTRKISMHNIDNYTRYYVVRIAGKKKWLE